MKPDGWIDAHVHVWPEMEKSNPRRFTADDLLANARANGVQRIVLIQPGQFKNDNSYMLDAIARFKGVFSGVAIVDTPEQMRAIRKKGVRGFRVTRGFDTDAMKEMWKTAAEEHMAMCPLINPAVLPDIGRLCAEYPETTVVVDHIARIGADGTIRDSDIATLCALAKFKVAHVKISAFYALGRKQPPYTDLVPLIQRVYEAFGAQRLMWASDSPYQVIKPHTYAASIELVRDHLDFLRGDDRQWMLRRTAEKVFFK